MPNKAVEDVALSAPGQLTKLRGQIPCKRPRMAIANLATIALHNRDNFRRAAGQETLIADIDVMLGEWNLTDRNTGGLRKFDHGAPCAPF